MTTSIIIAVMWISCGLLEAMLDVRYWRVMFPGFDWYIDKRDWFVLVLGGPLHLGIGLYWRGSNGRK